MIRRAGAALAYALYLKLAGRAPSSVVYGESLLLEFMKKLYAVEWHKVYKYRKTYKAKSYEYERPVWKVRRSVYIKAIRMLFSLNRYAKRNLDLVKEVVLLLTPTPRAFFELRKIVGGKAFRSIVADYVKRWNLRSSKLVKYLSAVSGGIKKFWCAVYRYCIEVLGIDKPTKWDLYDNAGKFKLWWKTLQKIEGVSFLEVLYG